MPNIQIISFGDKGIYTGKVQQIGKETRVHGGIVLPIIISNKTYNESSYSVVDSSVILYFTDRSGTLDFARELKVSQRIHVLTQKNSRGDAFVIEASSGDPHWTLSDGKAEMNVMYGNCKILSEDEGHGYVKVACNDKEITFWNDKEQDRAQRIKKVFRNRSLQSYIVTGKKTYFNGKEEYKGYYFITD